MSSDEELPVEVAKSPVAADSSEMTPAVDKEDNKEEPNEDAKSGDEEDKAKKAKKKKKKSDKKKEVVEKEDKKGKPGKSQLTAMREALAKVKEEEERRQKEAEEEEKRRREAEDRLLAEMQREKERKEKKKLREKERIKRQKEEGRFLTAEQKLKAERSRQLIAHVQQQGGLLPPTGTQAEVEQKVKRPIYGDKRKKKPVPNAAATTGDANKVAPVATEEAKENELLEEVESDVDDEDSEVLDSWDSIGAADSTDAGVGETRQSKGAENNGNESGSEGSGESDDEAEPTTSSDEESSAAPPNETKEQQRDRVTQRLKATFNENEAKRTLEELRSPVVCVLGHVDVGKTKILDKIRHTNVQDSEAGGITQQIGATEVPAGAICDQAKMVIDFSPEMLLIPGLLIIDTPGHESFSNLRSRGSSLCDIAILVVDLMHALEPQTIESINLLKTRKTPFIVALNKVDLLYEWKKCPNKDIREVLKLQQKNTLQQYEDRVKEVKLQFAEQGLNVALFHENPDPLEYISMIPVSAISGDGMGNLMAYLIQHCQRVLPKRLSFSENLQCTVLEVKAIPGLGTTIDVILVTGRLKIGNTIIVPGVGGPIVTQIRDLLMPQPLKEMRVKNPYRHFKELKGAQGVKILAKDLDKSLAGLPLLVAKREEEVEILKEEVAESLKMALQSINLSDAGVYVQASTLGSLEALLSFLRDSKIPYSGINIGPVHRRDVMKASTMLEREESHYAVILAFDVKVEREAQEMADQLGVRIFQADIIYHLFDAFTQYTDEWKRKKREENAQLAVFPCKLKILPQFIFNSRNPLVMGVIVEDGIVKLGTPICVPSKEFIFLGNVTSIEVNKKPLEAARKGQEVCVKIDNPSGDAPKMYGRHFDHEDMLVSRISRETIDVLKNFYRDELQKADWQLIVELKKIFTIL